MGLKHINQDFIETIAKTFNPSIWDLNFNKRNYNLYASSVLTPAYGT